MMFPECSKCIKKRRPVIGKMLPFSDVNYIDGAASKAMAGMVYDQWVCSNPDCHFKITKKAKEVED